MKTCNDFHPVLKEMTIVHIKFSNIHFFMFCVHKFYRIIVMMIIINNNYYYNNKVANTVK